MVKKKSDGPNFAPESQPKMTDEDKDRLFVHLIRRKAFFEEALARLPLSTLRYEDIKYRVILKACHDMAKKAQARPGDKKFKGLLKDEVLKIAHECDLIDEETEIAEDITSKGGFIDEAFDVDKADLSDELGRTLLKRFLYEVEIVNPLKHLLSKCSHDDRLPTNLSEVLEKLLERSRKQESIDTKTVKTVEEEWDEHNARLDYYRGKTMIGVKTGLPELDKRTLGLRGVFVFGAKPGAGKTTYACVEIALGVCRHHADNDCVVIVVSLDMERFELYRRIHCNLGGIEWVPLMFGSPAHQRPKDSMFSKAHRTCLQRAEKKLKKEEIGERLTVVDRTILGEDVTEHRLAAIIAGCKKKAGAKRALLIIDYLQLISVPDEVLARGDLAADKYRIRLVQQIIERSRTADDPLGDTALVISEARKPPTPPRTRITGATPCRS